MAINKAYTGTKPAIDRSATDIPFTEGIYKGIVKKIDTATRAGRLYVYIVGFGGNDPNNPANWTIVNYASPFMGTTSGPTYLSGATAAQVNNYSYTRQTYGMFMTPPDIGNQVLCCFPSGESKEGYWFACVVPNLSKHMIPAGGAVAWDKIEDLSKPADLLPFLKPGTPYPVGEFNENDPNAFKAAWSTQNKYPLNPYLTSQLIKQGLDQDPSRGAISSSMQRDTISSVFGVNTPGRPVPQQDPKNIPNIADLIATGQYNQATVTNRVDGHSFVMDDGDLGGNNNLVRLKTAAGHQLLMNDTDGFIYIANSTGTAWVELTKEGDILVYGANDLALRTSGNIMMHSDRNIMLNARGVIDMYAAVVRAETEQAILLNSKNAIAAEAESGIQLKSDGGLGIDAATSMSIKSGLTMSIDATLVSINSAGAASGLGGTIGGITSSVASLGSAASAIGSASNFTQLAKAAYSGYKSVSKLIKTVEGLKDSDPASIPRYTLPDTRFTAIGWTVVSEALQSICYRLPTHEPYIRGNIDAIIASQSGLNTQGEPASVATVDGEVTTAINVKPGLTVELAKSQPADNPAPTSAFIKQPAPTSGIGVLNTNQLRAYYAQTAYTESGGSYIPANPTQTVPGVNSGGYAGKYQLGSAALQGVGYVKAGTPQTVEALNNPNNWIGGPGKPSNLQEFLNTGAFQESAMQSYTRSNYSTLQKNGIITSTTPADEIAGLLSGAHIAGATGVTKWYQGGLNAADANGTTIADYYNNGRYSQTQVPVIVASNASKQVK